VTSLPLQQALRIPIEVTGVSGNTVTDASYHPHPQIPSEAIGALSDGTHIPSFENEAISWSEEEEQTCLVVRILQVPKVNKAFNMGYPFSWLPLYCTLSLSN
jgi:hypothetical protein